MKTTTKPHACKPSRSLRLATLASVAATALVVSGCHRDMWVQPTVKPLAASDFFPDQQGSRLPVPNTIAQDELRTAGLLHTGRLSNGQLAPQLPWKMTVADLKRGKERFDIFCSPCHGRVGNGQGMIAQRGLALKKQPANYHDPLVAAKPNGHYFDVITNGFGIMYSYASRVEVADRWRIVAYIRALQYSQNVPVAKMSPEDMKRLQETLISEADAARSTGEKGVAAHE